MQFSPFVSNFIIALHIVLVLFQISYVSRFHSIGRRCTALDSEFRIERSNPGLSPGRGHFVVFLGKRPYTHSVSQHRVVMDVA